MPLFNAFCNRNMKVLTDYNCFDKSHNKRSVMELESAKSAQNYMK